MGRAYSADLRERVVGAVDRGEGSQRQIARRFGVSLSFVVRMLQRRRSGGGLEPKPHGGGAGFKLSVDDRIRLFDLVREHPDATLKELKERGGFDCTLMTVWRMLRRAGWTRKKKSLHADERDRPKAKAARGRFRRKARSLDAKRLVFLDESGLRTSMTPTRAWAPRGRRAEGAVPRSWTSTTVIAALGLDGVRGVLAFPGALDESAFGTFVEEVLVPRLRPGDVVVMDNLKAHHSAEAVAAIRRVGARFLRLPPYSPDYNPIEEMWSKIKERLRRLAARTTSSLYAALSDALGHVTTKDIAGWFKHSKLYAVPE